MALSDFEEMWLSRDGYCSVLGIPMSYDLEYGNCPSVDRIIPKLGYVKGNIRLISTRANTLRSNASKEELFLIYKDLLNIDETYSQLEQTNVNDSSENV